MMRYFFIFSLLFTIIYCKYCYPSEFARSRLVSGPANDDVNVTVTEYPDRYVYSAEGYELSYSNGGPITSRGLLIVPDDNVHGGSYSHYAWEMALIGHHVVIMKSIDGLSEEEVFGKIVSFMSTDLDLHAWALLGHGRGGKIVSTYAKIDNGSRIKSVMILASDFDVDLSDGKRQVIVAYGLQDDIVDPVSVQQSIQQYGSYETYIEALDIGHMDFAFAECRDDNKFHFESMDIPVFITPNKTGSILVLNSNNKIITHENELLVSCIDTKVEYFANNTWIDINSNVFNIRSYINYIHIELRTFLPEYDDLMDILDGQRVKITIKCGIKQPSSVEFYFNSKPSEKALEYRNTYQTITNLAMGLMAWRNGDQRGKSMPQDRIIELPSTNPLKPIPTHWYVWENVTATRGIIFYVGGAVHPSGYGGIATLLRERGYTVIIPASVSRFSMLSVGESMKIVNYPEFNYIQNWTLSGHSMGAYSAAMSYTFTPNLFDSVIMFSGTLSTLDYRNYDVPVVNVFGTKDDVNPGGYLRYQYNFGPYYNPNTTEFIIVEGANHYYVGDYGDQKDSVATMSRDEQQRIFADILHNKVQNL